MGFEPEGFYPVSFLVFPPRTNLLLIPSLLVDELRDELSRLLAG